MKLMKSLTVCAALAVAVVGCSNPGSDATAQATAVDAAPDAAGACRLLTSSEVGAVFAGAERGEVDESRKEYGISACTWSTAGGTFVAQFWSFGGASAQEEAQGLIAGVLDPLKGEAARKQVRYEDMPGVGEQAVAVIEAEDAQRGVLNDFAMLVSRRGDRILVLIAPQLARSDRAKALKDLQALGKSAAGRL
jgi:hypothetical protein